MDEGERVRTSKFLSLVLRHQPETIGLVLDSKGWASVNELLSRCQASGRRLTRAALLEVVETSPKQRFALSADGLRIRANQGHSVAVDLALAPVPPPALLFHGTVDALLPDIRKHGLLKMKRHHVHLSADQETALLVGARRGKPLILVVRAGEMVTQAHSFYRSANGVWLTDAVPPGFIDFPS